SNCPRCGNISFEYPFGIGSGCFRAGFNLTCINQATDPPSQRLLLGNGTIEVIDFDMDNGIVYVKTPIVTMDVDQEYISPKLIDPGNFPFSFNLLANLTSSFGDSLTSNEIYVAGCSANAYLVDLATNTTIDSCSTTCYPNSSTPHAYCTISMYYWNAANFASLEIRLTRLNQNEHHLFNASPIKAFMYHRSNFTEDIEKILNGTGTQVIVATLGYYITDQTTCKEAKKDMMTYACRSYNSDCFDIFPSSAHMNYTIGYICRCSLSYHGYPYIPNGCQGNEISGYRCQCNDGYEGNPYLRNGCRDIDECSIPQKYVCYGTCTNTMGSYTCACPPGSSGDPRQRACIPDKKPTLCYRAGVIIGASNGAGLLLLSTSLIILRTKWKKRKQKRIREKHFGRNHGLLLQQLISSREDVDERTRIFPLEEIEKATNNFDETRVLDRGGHGTVYKGILSDQRVVAIKKSKIVKKSEIDQFINEVAILSQINHRNVVKLFGCCLETEVPLLIYEFISNGALSDHLRTLDGSCVLSWETRLRIAAETAGALAYLHSAA
ncbi:unnamed protein product, partial [Musa banksii]